MLAICGGFISKHDARLKKIENDQVKDHDDLATHKLESEKRYAERQSVQFSLDRIHTRLDETAKIDDIIELRGDIKNLIKAVGSK